MLNQKLPIKAFSLERAEDGKKWEVVSYLIDGDKVYSKEILSSEEEAQYARERFKVVTVQAGFCER